MADINAVDLTAETLSSLDGNENVVAFDTAEGKKIPISVLADYAIQSKTQTLAGSTQTPQAAINALNTSKPTFQTTDDMSRFTKSDYTSYVDLYTNGTIKQVIKKADTTTLTKWHYFFASNTPTSTDCDAVKSIGVWYVTWTAHYPSESPTASGYLVVLPHPSDSKYVKQIFMPYDQNMMFLRYCSNNTWSSWEKQPTRDEIDTIKPKSITFENNVTATIDKKYHIIFVLRFFNGANKYAVFARDFGNVVGSFVNTFTSSELTVTYSASTGWSVENHVGGNIMVYGVVGDNT